MLDAATAHAVAGFLHWTTIALMRLHGHWGPYDSFADVQSAAHLAREYWEGEYVSPEFKKGDT